MWSRDACLHIQLSIVHFRLISTQIFRFYNFRSSRNYRAPGSNGLKASWSWPRIKSTLWRRLYSFQKWRCTFVRLHQQIEVTPSYVSHLNHLDKGNVSLRHCSPPIWPMTKSALSLCRVLHHQRRLVVNFLCRLYSLTEQRRKLISVVLTAHGDLVFDCLLITTSHAEVEGRKINRQPEFIVLLAMLSALLISSLPGCQRQQNSRATPHTAEFPTQMPGFFSDIWYICAQGDAPCVPRRCSRIAHFPLQVNIHGCAVPCVGRSGKQLLRRCSDDIYKCSLWPATTMSIDEMWSLVALLYPTSTSVITSGTLLGALVSLVHRPLPGSSPDFPWQSFVASQSFHTSLF